MKKSTILHILIFCILATIALSFPFIVTRIFGIPALSWRFSIIVDALATYLTLEVMNRIRKKYPKN